MSTMDCLTTQKLLSAMLDGELPSDLTRSVERHLNQCSRCTEEAEELRFLSAIVREAGTRAPVGLGARISCSARDTQQSPASWTAALAAAWPRAAAVLVGAASVALISFPLRSAPSSPVETRTTFNLLAFESQAELDLAGSFGEDFQALARRPEGLLLHILSGGER